MSRTLVAADATQDQWLQRYYYSRALFSVAWVVAALALGTGNPAIAAILLVAYPAWDAVANWVDASSSGGLSKNPTQRISVWTSALAALAVAAASTSGMHAVLAVIGAWAIASGLLQLGTAVRRWKTHGAQWAMILSGAQSALAGGFFIAQSRMDAPPSIANVAGYTGVGALYFLISGIWLTIGRLRNRRQFPRESMTRGRCLAVSRPAAGFLKSRRDRPDKSPARLPVLQATGKKVER